ncbi:RNA helicase [Dispira simplex]|nr:RNA helicase [Dispira simplex]
MHYYENPGGAIPDFIVNWAMKAGIPAFIKNLHDACQRYKKSVAYKLRSAQEYRKKYRKDHHVKKSSRRNDTFEDLGPPGTWEEVEVSGRPKGKNQIKLPPVLLGRLENSPSPRPVNKLVIEKKVSNIIASYFKGNHLHYKLSRLNIARHLISKQLPAFAIRYKRGEVSELHWENLMATIEGQQPVVLENIIIRSFLNHLLETTPRTKFNELGELPLLKKLACLKYPQEWFPGARRFARRIVMHVGPTNSGKTHQALQKLERARRGIYCGPLRLLAHEIYTRMNTQGIGCNLLTGEDRRTADHDVPLLSATVEMADFNTEYDVAVLDEIQMIGDTHRGFAWTDALFGLQARELHLCGEPSAVPIVKKLMALVGDEVEVHEYQRLSRMELSPRSLDCNLTQLKRGDCVITFSRKNIYQIKSFIEKETPHRCAVIYGNLPPETRAQQAQQFNDPTSDTTVLVSSDAIGMGINLNIGRIIFTALDKYNGVNVARLSASHVRQIAGRAGRFNTEFNPGYVTAVLPRDMPILRKSIETIPPMISKARVTPRLEMLEKFAHQLPDAKFTEILSLFEMTCDLGQDLSLGDMGTGRETCVLLNDLQLSIADKYLMSFAPLVERDIIGEKVCANMVSYHAEDKECRIGDLFTLPTAPPTSPDALVTLEIYHKCLMAYLWLSYKFPATYVEQQVAQEAKEKCEDLIEQGLMHLKLDADPSALRQIYKKRRKNLDK